MKKKVLSLLLALVLVIGVTALTTMAAENTDAPAAQEYKYCKCGGYLDSEVASAIGHTCANETWTPLTQEMVNALAITEKDAMGGDSYTLTQGNYVLVEDVTLDKSLLIPRYQADGKTTTTVKLDLNGHTLSGGETLKYAVVARGNFQISDCAYDPADPDAVWGKLVGASNPSAGGSALYVCSTSTAFLYGGEIRSGATQDTTGGPLAVSGKFHICDGQVVGFTTTGNGGAITINDSGTLTVWGGKVIGGQAKNGGAIYMTYRENYNPKLVIRTKGVVTGGTATEKGNCIYAITDVQVKQGAQVDGIYLNGTAKVLTEKLTGQVGLEVAAGDYRVVATATEDDAKHLVSVMPARYYLTYTNGEVAFVDHLNHCQCGGNLSDSAKAVHTDCATEEWIALTNANILDYLVASDANDGGSENYLMFKENGSYYLAEDIATKKPLEIHNGDDINLCLNGYNWTYTKGYKVPALRVWGNLNICDCVGTGKVSSNSDAAGSVMYLFNNKAKADFTVNIYGGTFTATHNVKTVNGGVIKIGSDDTAVTIHTVLNIFGGTITGGTGAQGGNIYMGQAATMAGSVSLNIHGGEITNGAASTRGGNIYANRGTITMTGGVVTGGTLDEAKAQYGADIAISGNTPVGLTLNGQVTIGEIGAYGSTDDKFAIALGDNFTTDAPIKVSASKVGKVIKGATLADLAYFVPADDSCQFTLLSDKIWLHEAAERYACYCGGTYNEPGNPLKHTCTLQKWTAITPEFLANGGFGEITNSNHTSLGGDYYHVPAGSYYLTEDITLDAGLRLTGATEKEPLTVYIDLNGHKLTFSDKASRAFFVNGYGKLYVSDSSYDATQANKADQFQGQVAVNSANNYNIAYVSGNGELRIFGGKFFSEAEGKNTHSRMGMAGKTYVFDGYLVGGDKAGNGRVFALNNSDTKYDENTQYGQLAFYRATAVGGNVDNGGILTMTTAGQKFTMYSGELIGGTASKNGGAINADGGTVDIRDGVIRDGVAGVYGGNICVNCKATINGATILDGQAEEGGNIAMRSNSEMTISGQNTQILDGVASKNGGNMAVFGKLTITDATISGGIAGLNGGNIYGYANKTDITINSGSITNGSVVGTDEDNNGSIDQAAEDLYGYNIVVKAASNRPVALTIHGGTITGAGLENMAVSGVQPMSDGECTINISGAPVIDHLRLGTGRMLTVGELTEGASISVSRFEVAGLFAPGYNQEQFFSSAIDGVNLLVTEEGLALISENPYWAFDKLANPIESAATIDQAAAIPGCAYVRLVQDHDAQGEEVNGTVVLDLYGRHLTNLVVNGTVYGVDTKSNTIATGWYGTLMATKGENGVITHLPEATKEVYGFTAKYLTLMDGDAYTFQKYNLTITHLSLDTNRAGFGYKATIEINPQGKALLESQMSSFGFYMGLSEDSMKRFELTGGKLEFSLRLNNILTEDGQNNAEYALMNILAVPFVTVGQQEYVGAQVSCSLKDGVEALNAALEKNANAFTAEQIQMVQDFCKKYELIMTDWNLETILAWVPATEPEQPAA